MTGRGELDPSGRVVILSVHSPRAAHNLQQLEVGTVLQNSKDLHSELLQSASEECLHFQEREEMLNFFTGGQNDRLGF
jgi:hypothetical protein